MPLQLTPKVARTLEIYLESMDEFDNLVEGLREVMWTYLEDHIDEGVDVRITGNFLKNFYSLLELFLSLHEHSNKQQ